jgi:hypothetical protein
MKEEDKMKEKNPDTEQEAQVVIDEAMIPMKNPEVTVREEMEEDGKYILFNAENELILVVNPTGKFVFDNCDGKKTVGQIIRKFLTVPVFFHLNISRSWHQSLPCVLKKDYTNDL